MCRRAKQRPPAAILTLQIDLRRIGIALACVTATALKRVHPSSCTRATLSARPTHTWPILSLSPKPRRPGNFRRRCAAVRSVGRADCGLSSHPPHGRNRRCEMAGRPQLRVGGERTMTLAHLVRAWCRKRNQQSAPPSQVRSAGRDRQGAISRARSSRAANVTICNPCNPPL